MTKKDHYTIDELTARWSKHPISRKKQDVLGLGVQGLIQFSIESKKLQQNAQHRRIKTSWYCVTGGKVLECVHSCDLPSAKYVKLTKQTILNLSKAHNEKSTIDLHPWCEYCSHGRFPENCVVEYELGEYSDEYLQTLDDDEMSQLEDGLICGLDDLVITHEEVRRFEKQFDCILAPPYLDSAHIGYCEELAVTVETWRAIFEYKNVMPEKTCKMTVETYLKENHHKLEGDTDRGTGSLGRIAVMLNSVDDQNWKKFKNNP